MPTISDKCEKICLAQNCKEPIKFLIFLLYWYLKFEETPQDNCWLNPQNQQENSQSSALTWNLPYTLSSGKNKQKQFNPENKAPHPITARLK